MKAFELTAAALAAALPLGAQWLHLPTPGIPRTADGKPDLAAPAPRTSDGKPDLSGLWEKKADKYYNNIAADLKPGEVQAWADALYQQRKLQFGKDSPETQCMPTGPATIASPYLESRILQTPSIIAVLNDNLTFRQIFMDGRKLEKDPNPTWMGLSVGHWEGDTLVVESNGYNDRTWLDFDGHPHSEDLRVVERYRRRDFGHMEVVATFEDAKIVSHSWTIPVLMELVADKEMLEFVCENEKDRAHMREGAAAAPVSEVKVSSETLARYAGQYEIRQGDKTEIAEISVSGGGLIWERDGQGKQKLVPLSPATFSLSGSWIEFVAAPDGSITHFAIQEVEGETKGVRKK